MSDIYFLKDANIALKAIIAEDPLLSTITLIKLFMYTGKYSITVDGNTSPRF